MMLISLDRDQLEEHRELLLRDLREDEPLTAEELDLLATLDDWLADTTDPDPYF